MDNLAVVVVVAVGMLVVGPAEVVEVAAVTDVFRQSLALRYCGHNEYRNLCDLGSALHNRGSA